MDGSMFDGLFVAFLIVLVAVLVFGIGVGAALVWAFG